MKKLFTKIIACVAIVSLVASMGLTALAHTEMENMEFVGYDTTDPYAPNKIYNEVIGGKLTNKWMLVPVEPEWKLAEGYEAVYPYAGYDRMLLEGNETEITRYNSLFPQWETRRQDYFWEIKHPHVIWERQQTKVPGKGWTWDFGNEKFNIADEVVLTKTIREAVEVNVEYLPYGFAWYNNAGEILSLDEQQMYKDFGVYDKAIASWEALVSEGALSVASLSALDEYGSYVMTDEMIAEIIPAVYSKYVTAKYNKDSDEGLATKNVALEYLVNEIWAEEKANWEWDADSLVIAPAKTISWTDPIYSYEMEEPYNQYQYLIVNGIVLDGKDGSPEVLRYTSGKALPKVEWKFECFEEKYMDGYSQPIYAVVEAKYVDGVKAYDLNGDAILRNPTGVYGSVYVAFNEEDKNIIEIWVADEEGNKELLDTYENFTGTLESFIDAYFSGSLRLTTIVEEDQYALLP